MKNSRFAFLRRPLFWLALVVLALIAGGAYFYFNQTTTRPQATAAVTRGDLKATVNANARVRAEKTVRLAFPFSGLVTTVHVQEGEDVEQGEVLVEMDRTELNRRLEQAKMSLESRAQDLQEAQQPPQAAELEIAQQSLKKAALALAAAENRYKDNASDENRIGKELAQSDYEIARANFERQTRSASQGQIDDLERAVQNARYDLQAAQDAYDKTRLAAPFGGVITEINAKAGELFGGYNAVVEVADLHTLQLVAEIDEIDVAEVNAGQPVTIRFDAFPGQSAKGTLSRLFPSASNDRGATVYRAIVGLEATELKLRPGMGATIEIATIEKTNVLRVPSRAIKNAGTQKIVVVQAGNETRNVVVETGLSDGNNTEIISGVSEGTIVVVE